jgi:hypothetical protein
MIKFDCYIISAWECKDMGKKNLVIMVLVGIIIALLIGWGVKEYNQNKVAITGEKQAIQWFIVQMELHHNTVDDYINGYISEEALIINREALQNTHILFMGYMHSLGLQETERYRDLFRLYNSYTDITRELGFTEANILEMNRLMERMKEIQEELRN